MSIQMSDGRLVVGLHDQGHGMEPLYSVAPFDIHDISEIEYFAELGAMLQWIKKHFDKEVVV